MSPPDRFLLAGVMGWPIMHSRSPRLHGYWLDHYGLAGAYVPLAIKAEGLEAALRALPALGFAGCNLTIPHKEAALRIVDEASAREFGFPALAALSWAWTAMLTALLEVTTTAGELGMLAAHEGSNGPSNFFSIAAPLRPYMAACPPYDAPAAACFADNYTRTGRALPYTVTLSNAGCSREWCAQACVDAGYALAGVEFGVACFCGDAMPPPADALPVAACAAMACAGAPAERCGDADVISIFPAACPAAPDLPPGLLPARGYAGARRAWQMPVRTTVAAAEGGLDVRVAVLAPAPPAAVALTWWLVPGPAANETLPLTLVAAGRGLWHARVPLPADDSKVLVYVVDVAFDDGGRLAVPVEGAQTVVVL